MKWFDQAENWTQAGFRYRPGDDLETTTPIIHPSRVQGNPNLAEYLKKNPDLLKDFFWNDGMVRVSGREYNGLKESPCFKGGKFSCLSCHSMHDSEPDDQLARYATVNESCVQCHQAYATPATLQAHTRHLPNSAGSSCYNCHMPHTTYGVLKAIRSHQISNPKISSQLTTGRPNACNLCHLDKPLAWTASALKDWFGHQVPPLGTNETTLAEGLRLALTGDAGQRAIMAWHLGWEPTFSIAGRNWQPLILAYLLDDPYSAVRCIAERSLKVFGQGLTQGYDYTVPPTSRAGFRQLVTSKWLETQPILHLPDHVRSLSKTNSAELTAVLEALSAKRDERPIRLRE